MTITLDEAATKAVLAYVEPALKGNDYLMQSIKRSRLGANKKQDLLEVIEGHALALTQLQTLLKRSTPPDNPGIPVLKIEVKD